MPPTLGEAVRRLRRSKKLTQEGVAKRSKGRISESWVASVETNRIEYSDPEKLTILADILGVRLGDLYREAGIEVSTSEAAQSDLSPDKQDLLREYDRLPPALKRVAYNVIHNMNEEAEAKESRRAKPATSS